MGADQLFKEVLRDFFKDFVELFLPEAASRLDFGTLRFPNRELFKGFPEGRRREPDVVAELRTVEGQQEIVLVHVEVQKDVRKGFGQRMLEYYALLWLQFNRPVFPVLLRLSGGDQKGISIAEYRKTVIGQEIVRFRYASIALARLSAREYVEASPLAAAMSALMRRGRNSEELELRARMLRRVFASDLDERRKYLLVNMVETYFELSPEEEESFRRMIARKEYREVQSTKLTWGDKLILEGHERGMVQGKRDTLKRLLAAKFGPLPKETEARIDAASSVDELDRYLDRVLVATSLRDVF